MSLVTPNSADLTILQLFLNQGLVLRLFSNNHVPVKGDTAAAYTEVAGGGYAAISLPYASWTISTIGSVNQGNFAQQIFTFTGPTNAPGTIYGYYVTDSGGNLLWAEQFPAAQVPFSPVLNSSIAISPHYEAA